MGMVSKLYLIIGCLSIIKGSPLLLFANRKDVRMVEGNNSRGNSTVVAGNLEDAAAVDFLYEDRSVFFTDVSQEMIKRTWFNGSEITVNVITTGLISPDGLAVDWLGRKIYWTDSETKRIEVANLDGSYRKVLYWNDLDQPRAIALDPLNGYMYWTDWGETPKIERAGMDGTHAHRSVIIKENIHWPNGLTLDYEDSQIYWADAKNAFIHSCKFDGSDRRVVVEGELPHPFALTLYDRTLYWTDWKDRSINSCDKITGSNRRVILRDIYSPMDIHSFSARRQPKDTNENACDKHNGGCSHLCLMSPAHPFYTCACPTGIKLKLDNKTCNEGYEQLLLLARRTDLRRISLDTPDYTDVVLELTNVQHAIAIDFDPVDNQVYWTDDEVHAIWRANIDGTGQEKVIDSHLMHPDGIAVDWIGRNLYWTDTGTDRIEVSRLNGTSRRVLIAEDLEEPRAITLDPISGYMYWTDWGKKPKIERANMDGSGRLALVNVSLGWPNGIAVDHAEMKIYWGDASLDKIEVANYDGTGRRVLVNQNLPHLFGFSLLGDYIYWTDWQRRSIERVNKRSGIDRKTIVDQLPDLMGLKAVNLVKIEGTNPCAHNNGECSHLCLMTPNKSVCACPMGLELSGNSKTCIIPEAFLIFSGQQNIKRLSLESNHRIRPIPIRGIKEAPIAIDYDINDNRIYWTDATERTISRAFMNGSAVEKVIQYGLEYPEGMVVDWVAKNIYWVDTGSKRIEVARTDGTSRRVIVWKELHQPRALAIDPANGHIYWTDWSEPARLERAALDGTGRQVVVEDIGKVHAITIDFTEKKIFWASIDKAMIESANINGTNRTQIITNQVPKPMGLTLYNDFIFWADWEQQTVEKANKTNGNNRTTLRDHMGVVMDILVYHSSRQAGTNSCHDKNGGCSHLCLAHPIEDGKNLSHHCACPTHYKLNADNKTCSAPKTFLLFSQKNVISRLVIDNDDVDPQTPEVVLPIPHLKNVKGLAYDPVDHYIYWIEGKQNNIKRSTDNGTNVQVIVRNDNEAYKPYDMAIDPYSRVIYWTDAKRNVINITRLDGTSLGVVIEGDKEKPRSIVLNPLKGHMYWVNMVQPPTIDRAAMDGTERMTLFSKALGKPGPLAVDVQNSRLYWADGNLNRIECSDLSGGNRIVLVDGQIASPKGMAVLGKYLYWIDRDHMLMSRADKLNGKDRTYIQGRLKGLSDLHVALNVLPKHMEHPCAHNNGGCSHICVAKGDGSSRCACPTNLDLKDDLKMCADPPTCSPDQFACLSGDIHCIPRTWRCDKSEECQDASDESNCPICHADQFRCNDNHCIDQSSVCDGTPQCHDHSDEEHCCLEGDTMCPHTTPPHSCKGPNCPGTKDPSNPSTAHYTIIIVIGLIVLVLILGIIFACKRKSQPPGVIIYETDMSVVKPLTAQTTLNSLSSHGKSHETGLSLGSVGTTGIYDRNHVTGASSSSSTVTQYPHETLNPPPSPVTTDRSVCNGEFYGYSSNSPSTVRSYRPYKLRPVPPPHTTPCSTDVCEESEPYPYNVRTKKHKSKRSIMELFSDYDPYPPCPTPRSHYFSDDMISCPPSPSTERSFSNPYPPPPSPVANSDC
ncbi:low-density lipoprotein receptor-related protein 6-like isoform X1 [Mytilus galloprovincialis]|uniref:low-density lipoprotein receptor-related protein 6-like isoform X1 n=1 Tax=Mytilus galloprovincialis TaxID=29158 RepID=UPI003F7CA570